MVEGCRVHVRHEPPSGDPLRRWGSGGLCEHLDAGIGYPVAAA